MNQSTSEAKFFFLLGFLVFLLTSNAQITITKSSVASTIYPDLISLNGRSTEGPSWTDNSFLSFVSRMNPAYVRYPAGTIGNQWDWHTGTFIPGYGSNSNFPFTIPMLIDGLPTDSKIIYMVNMVLPTPTTGISYTSSTDPVLSTQETLDAKIDDILLALETFSSNGHLPEVVELGNELYFSNEEAGVYAANSTLYLNHAKQIAAAVKAEYPSMKILLCTTKGGTSSRDSWNTAVINALNNDLTFRSYIYGIVQHHYINDNYGYTGVVNSVETAKTIISEGVQYVQDVQSDYNIVPSDIKLWITEYGATKTNANGMWAAGLRTALMSMAFANMGSRVENLSWHHITQDPNILVKSEYKAGPSGLAFSLLRKATRDKLSYRKLNFSNMNNSDPLASLTGYYFEGNGKQSVLLINNDNTTYTGINISGLFSGNQVNEAIQYWSDTPYQTSVYEGNNIQTDQSANLQSYDINPFSLTMIEMNAQDEPGTPVIIAGQQIGTFPGMHGGFEGLAGGYLNTSVGLEWSAQLNNSSEIVTTGNARTGMSYAQTTQSGTTNIRVLQTPLVSGVATGNYVIQYYYRGDSDGTATATMSGGLNLNGTAGNYSSNVTPNSAGWSKFTFTKSISGPADLYAFIRMKDNAAMDFDDFVIYPGTSADVAAPESPSQPETVSGTNNIQLSWTSPADIDGGGFMVVRSTSSSATTPNSNGIYAIGNQLSANEVVVYLGTNTATNDTGLIPNTAYTYHVYTVDKAFNYSPVVSISTATNRVSITSAQSGSWSSASTWTGSKIPVDNEDVVIQAGHEVTIGAVTVGCNGLKINPRGALSVNNGTLHVVNLNIKSDATGTGTLVDNGTIVLTGNSSVEQYLSSGRNWYVSSPVNNANSGVFNASASTTNKLYQFQEPSATTAPWLQITNNTTALIAGKGYVAQLPQDGVVTFAGTLNNENLQIVLSKTGSHSKSGFNLVGNPFPAYLNMRTGINATSGLEKTLWYRTRSTGTSPVYYFETVNTVSGIGTNNAGTGIVTGNMPPVQGFWVKALEDNITLDFLTTNRSHAGQVSTSAGSVSSSPLKMATDESTSIIRLKVSTGIAGDELVFYTNKLAKNQKDEYDSPKLSNENSHIPELFFMQENTAFSVCGMNRLPLQEEIPVGFETRQAGSFNISSEVTGIDAETDVVLIDKTEHVETSLLLGNTYSFTAQSGKTDNRFSLLLKSKSTTTQLNSIIDGDFDVVTRGNSILIISSKSWNERKYYIHSLQGIKISEGIIRGNSINLPELILNGVYVLTISGENNKFIHKKISTI
jgi:hypothetical protein